MRTHVLTTVAGGPRAGSANTTAFDVRGLGRTGLDQTGQAVLAAIAVMLVVLAAVTATPQLLVPVAPAFAAVACWPRMVRSGLAATSVAGEPAGLAAMGFAVALGVATAFALHQVIEGAWMLAAAQIALVPTIIDAATDLVLPDLDVPGRTGAADHVASTAADLLRARSAHG